MCSGVKQPNLSDHFGILAKLPVADKVDVLVKHASAALGRHDSKHNDTQYYDIQHNGT